MRERNKIDMFDTIKSKKEKAMYYLEVAENMRHKAETVDKRIEKALEMGADDPKHEHHKLFLKLMEISERSWKYHTEYLASYSKETSQPLPDPEEEVKKNQSESGNE
jgi:hypothetical protein